MKEVESNILNQNGYITNGDVGIHIDTSVDKLKFKNKDTENEINFSV